MMLQSRKTGAAVCIFEKKCAAYQHFPVETYLAEQLFTTLKYLELIPSMEVYDTTFRLLEQETIDGRHIYETLSFLCGNEEVSRRKKGLKCWNLMILTLI